jgi:hypothetical protein
VPGDVDCQAADTGRVSSPLKFACMLAFIFPLSSSTLNKEASFVKAASAVLSKPLQSQDKHPKTNDCTPEIAMYYSVRKNTLQSVQGNK